MPVRIAVDAMGGDHAPREIVRGAVLYARLASAGMMPEAQIILVGDAARVQAELGDALGGEPQPQTITVRHAARAVAMGEHPTEAVKKHDSSLVVATTLVKNGEADAVFSAGNTGAMMVASFQILERIDGVRRPAIAAFLPQQTGRRFTLVDAGANVDCKPSLLLQFALLGSLYAEWVFGYINPRVGLLSNGEEEGKGDERTKEAHAILAEKAAEYGINFVGNIEGHYAFAGGADVIACDGFVGNVLLKSVEGMGETAMSVLARAANAAGEGAVRDALLASRHEIALGIDYAETGGAPLLGVNGVSMIGHGRSDARAIMNGIRQSVRGAQSGYVARTRTRFAELKAREAAG